MYWFALEMAVSGPILEPGTPFGSPTWWQMLKSSDHRLLREQHPLSMNAGLDWKQGSQDLSWQSFGDASVTSGRLTQFATMLCPCSILLT